MIVLGIDVGGTHTDAAIMDDGRFVDGVKVSSSKDVHRSILNALDMLTERQPDLIEQLDLISLGTTQFTNAVVERRALAPVLAIRLGAPSGKGLPSGVGWPSDLADHAIKASLHLKGGHLFTGESLSTLDDQDVASCHDLLSKHPDCPVVISAPFSPIRPESELDLAKTLAEQDPRRRFTCSQTMGGLGLLERENAAILNAALRPYAEDVVDGYHQALDDRSIKAPFFVSQNDGTVLSAGRIKALPALTFASGPTNSIRGVAEVTALQDAIVIDVGGTTSDIGVLKQGLPRTSHQVVEIETVRTHFRMPDLVSLGLGGGTLVHEDGTFGPESVGYELGNKALVFGGNTLTLSDIAVRAGAMAMGDPSLVAHLSDGFIDLVYDRIRAAVYPLVDQMRGEQTALPVIVVGGGAAILRPCAETHWSFLDAAVSGLVNAIGASAAEASGYADEVIHFNDEPRALAIERLTEKALDDLESSGGVRNLAALSSIEESHVPYLGNAWFRVKVSVRSPIAPVVQSPNLPKVLE